MCKMVSDAKRSLSRHIEPTFLAADLAIYSILIIPLQVSGKYETKKAQ